MAAGSGDGYETKPSAASAMFAEVGAGYETKPSAASAMFAEVGLVRDYTRTGT